MRALRLANYVPVLRRELVQLASNRRTYIMRAIYACLLFLFFSTFAYDTLRRFYRADDVFSALSAMGRGEDLLELICVLQFIGIYIFLPAMMAGAIADEKERHNFPLLLVTPLSPTEILIQKYVSRLIPMLTFLLLSIPILGVAYLLGGIETQAVVTAMYYLLIHCLQIGAYTLMFSAICRTFAGALIGSYVGYGIFALVVVVVESVTGQGDECLRLMPPVVFFDPSPVGSDGLAGLIPTIVSTVVFLGIARLCLVRCANPRSRHVILRFFAWLDRVMVRLNNRLARGILLVKDTPSTPGDRPIAWRERRRTALGRPQYVVRMALGIEICIFAGCLAAIIDDADWFGVMVFVLWGAAALTLCVHSVNLFGTERAHGTLQVLLTTPRYADDIVREKMQPLSRIMLLFLIPFLTLFCVRAISEGVSTASGIAAVWYMLLSTITVLIYLPLVAWMSCLIGMMMKKRARAIVTALSVLVAWVIGPLILVFIADEVFWGFYVDDGWTFVCPFGVIGELEFEYFDGWDLPKFVFYTLSHFCSIVALVIVRGVCLVRADRYLRRG